MLKLLSIKKICYFYLVLCLLERIIVIKQYLKIIEVLSFSLKGCQNACNRGILKFRLLCVTAI